MRNAVPKKFMKLKLRQGGYTLGELLVSMSVAGILASIAIPGMENIMLNNRRVSITNEFSYALQVARSEAVTRNQRVTVCASKNGYLCTSKTYWSTGWIVFNDLDLDGQAGDDGETVLMSFKGNESTTITPISFASRITYRPSGRAMGNTTDTNTGQFIFCDTRGSEHARVLIVGTNGRPRISETLANGNNPTCS